MVYDILQYAQKIKIPDYVMYNGILYSQDPQLCIDALKSNTLFLEKITLPFNNKVLTYNSIAQNSVTMKKFTIPEGVTTITGMFYNCPNLKKVYLPNSLTSINSSFIGCTNLQEITFPPNVTTWGNDNFIDSTYTTCSFNKVIFLGNVPTNGSFSNVTMNIVYCKSDYITMLQNDSTFGLNHTGIQIINITQYIKVPIVDWYLDGSNRATTDNNVYIQPQYTISWATLPTDGTNLANKDYVDGVKTIPVQPPQTS